MKVSGFSFVRNGFNYDCPFVEAIQSILPICDEFVVAVGDSTDGTREAIEGIASDKIRIIDTVWDDNLRKGGKIFSQQSNIALKEVKGDWAFHIQADEVIHENDLHKIRAAMEKDFNNEKTEGFILPFLHFWGDYRHYRNTRRVHNHEIRIFKNTGNVFSFRDSQGFRKYSSYQEYLSNEELGLKLRVKKMDAPVFHYNHVRTPSSFRKKQSEMGYFYGDDKMSKETIEKNGYDLNLVDRVAKFSGTHPKVMASRIAAHPNDFEHDTSKAVWKPKDKIMQPIEDFLGFKIGEYKNYILSK